MEKEQIFIFSISICGREAITHWGLKRHGIDTEEEEEEEVELL